MNIGYARVSNPEQKFDLQIAALKKAGCKTIFKETISGVKKERPELAKAIEKLKVGDCLVVWSLDRLGRSLKELIEIVTQLQMAKIGFISICDNLNSVTAQGGLLFHIFGSLAVFEKELVKERTGLGLSGVRARGRNGGRPAGLTEEFRNKAASIKLVYDSRSKSITEICGIFGVSAATLYKCLRYINAKENQSTEIITSLQ